MFEHYNKNLQFGDFKHALTGALLWKAQHPEAETFWGSKHDKAGLSEEALKPALEQHQKAHIYWEWWTAENSDGFHNPDAARESLTRSVEEAKKGIKAVDEALAAKKAAPAP